MTQLQAAKAMVRLALVVFAVMVAACDGTITLPGRGAAPRDPTTPLDPAKPFDPAECATTALDVGRPTIRRLNRAEYNNTVRDLLGDTTRPADGFPADDFGRGFDNNGDVLSTAPLLVEKYEAAAVKLAAAAVAAGTAGRVLSCDPATGAACVKQILSGFASRAWRRPVTPAEVDKLVGVVAVATSSGDSVQVGLQLAVAAVLLSPHFLFRVELDPDPASTVAHAVSDHELAARLSYFLWSSTPDQALAAEANAGTLSANLDAQTRRMLKDPKAVALVSQFAGSWLGTRGVEETTTSATLFPTVDLALKKSMRTQMDRFFQTFLDEDRSALELLGADYLYLDDALATHYGLPKPGTTTLSRVMAPGSERASILGHAGMLTLTSHATRTSPVLRGKWVMARLLCEEPPPPPAGVQGLKPEANPNASLRQQMEAHRVNPSCAVCHKVMDPIGFGMERFDPVGRRRTLDDTGFAIDSSGKLPDGRSFDGVAQLSQTIKADEKLPTCISRELFVFSLGRDHSRADACMLRELATGFKAKNYRLPELIVGLVQSPAFTQRRGETP